MLRASAGMGLGEGRQHVLNLWWDANQLADRLNGVSIVAKHPVEGERFRPRGFFFPVGHFSPRQ